MRDETGDWDEVSQSGMSAPGSDIVVGVSSCVASCELLDGAVDKIIQGASKMAAVDLRAGAPRGWSVTPLGTEQKA